MIGVRSMAVIGIGGMVLLAGFLLFGFGSGEPSGEGRAADLIPVAPAAKVKRVSVDPSLINLPKGESPPESTLGFGGQSVSSAGEILGLWEPEGLLAGSSGGSARNRTDGTELSLSDGGLLTVPGGSTLTFVYGGRQDPANFFDALAFEVERGELFYNEDAGTLSLRQEAGESLPTVLRVREPETANHRRVRVVASLPPGVYVFSVAASVPEGDARYNVRVVVE
ncbi:MAG: DUF4175 domain-containing protein [Actinomycetota bacterium]|nr:DUF4175 domain-containing protein [Actinomycetota bacterium]